MKKLFTLFCLLALLTLTACTGTPADTTTGSTTPAPTTPLPTTAPDDKPEISLSVMSFNIRYLINERDDLPQNENGPKRRERVIRVIREQAPDLLGLQEVTEEWMKVLDGALSEEYVFFGVGYGGDAGSSTTPVAYRRDAFDVIEIGTRWLSDTPETHSKVEESTLYRVMSFALLRHKTSGRVILYANTHLDHPQTETGETAREKQAEVLTELLFDLMDNGQERPEALFLTGDFNSVPEGKAYAYLLVSGFQDAALTAPQKDTGITYHEYGNDENAMRIDFCFYLGDATPTSFAVLRDMVDGDYPSDHYPILTRYRLD